MQVRSLCVVEIPVIVSIINLGSVSMEMQQCLFFSVVFSSKYLHCLYLLRYHNSLILFGLKRWVLQQYYAAINNINILHVINIYNCSNMFQCPHTIFRELIGCVS
jgi:hypothetical protein